VKEFWKIGPAGKQHTIGYIKPEGQQGSDALTAARNKKMSRSNISNNLQYDLQYDSIETKNKNPSLMNSGPERAT